MKPKIYDLAVAAGIEWIDMSKQWVADDEDIERFAQLVRDDERDECSLDYLQDCTNAIDAARLEEREACALLCEEWYLAGAAANAIRARGKA